ncbi:MAG TPA: AzlC family ABC transporter permease [Steroidobacteraceae bacterium]|nr:AzlC family ABC transporter permease [Steroidobacteraceae bacterium]
MPRSELPITFTRAGFRRGFFTILPFAIAGLPFGLVVGISAQAHGLSLVEAILMSGVVFAGSAQLLALGAWTVPASILAATFTTLVVNLRFVLMGPGLAPWLDGLRGARRWGSLFFLVDQNWAIALREIAAERCDAAFFIGTGVAFWILWEAATIAGHLLGQWIAPAPGHPLFFAALATFITILLPMWRSSRDLLPWIAAGIVALLVARLLPGTTWHIVAGAVAGGIVGACRDSLEEPA